LYNLTCRRHVNPFCHVFSFCENPCLRSAQSLRGRWLCTSLSFLSSASQLHVLIFLPFIIFMLYHSTESYSNILFGRRDLYGHTGIFWNIFSFMKYPRLNSKHNIYKYSQSQATYHLQVGWLRLWVFIVTGIFLLKCQCHPYLEIGW